MLFTIKDKPTDVSRAAVVGKTPPGGGNLKQTSTLESVLTVWGHERNTKDRFISQGG